MDLPVDGITCVRPRASAEEVAAAEKRLSCRMSDASTSGSTLYCAADASSSGRYSIG